MSTYKPSTDGSLNYYYYLFIYWLGVMWMYVSEIERHIYYRHFTDLTQNFNGAYVGVDDRYYQDRALVVAFLKFFFFSKIIWKTKSLFTSLFKNTDKYSIETGVCQRISQTLMEVNLNLFFLKKKKKFMIWCHVNV